MTGELTPVEAAEHALFWGAIATGMKNQIADARAEAIRVLSAQQILSQAVMDRDGVRLGTVTWAPPQLADPAVVDEWALLRWVEKNRPDEVVTTKSVRSSYVQALIANAKRQPEKVPIDPETGAIIPGIEIPEGERAGRLSVRPTPEGKARIRALLERGESLRTLTGSPEVPGGPESV